jgi:transposase InsO family protein
VVKWLVLLSFPNPRLGIPARRENRVSRLAVDQVVVGRSTKQSFEEVGSQTGVWEPENVIDGIAPYLLAVRDLASGHRLLWLPAAAATAAVTMAALTPLFLVYGAPLVLKTDNGSAFSADALRALLTRWQVLPLFSPPGTPSYNGSIEASIGALKTRTERHAAAAGHPGVWTSADVEAARQEANTTARRKRLQGRTPEAVWAARMPLTAAEGDAFQGTVEQCRVAARQEYR